MAPNSTRQQRQGRDVGKRRFRQNARRPLGERVHPVMRVAPVPSTKVVAGAVLLARIEFTDVADYKVRPVIVLSRDGDTVTVRPCSSSQRSQHRPGSVLVSDLEPAGMSRPTVVLSHSLLIGREALVSITGHLSPRDWARIHHPAGSGVSSAVGAAA